MAPWASLISLLRSNTNGDIVGDEMSALDIPVGTPCASCKEAGHSTCMAGVDDGGVFLCYACAGKQPCEYEISDRELLKAAAECVDEATGGYEAQLAVALLEIGDPLRRVDHEMAKKRAMTSKSAQLTGDYVKGQDRLKAKERQRQIARECHEKGMTKREARKLSGLSEPTVNKIYREEQEKAAGYKPHNGLRPEIPHAPKVGDVWMADEKRFGPSKIDAVGNLRFDANAVSLNEAPAIIVEEREVAIEELISRCVSEGPRARAINPQSDGEAYAQTAFEREKRIAEAPDLTAGSVNKTTAPLRDHYAAVIADLNLRIEALSDFRDLAIDLQRGL